MQQERKQERKFTPIDLYNEYINNKVKKWAVIVGISEYKDRSLNLKYAHRDAEELYQLLLTENGGNFKQENIRLLTNQQATKRNIEIALHDFLLKPDKNDLVILYFACHGAPNPKRPTQNLYLLTHDIEPDKIAATGLRMREIEIALEENLTANKTIILADTCHSGGIGGNIGNRSISDNSELVNRYLNSLSTAESGVALLTSAEAREVSIEGNQWGGGHGVFTHFVLEGMRGKADRNNNGIVTVGELFEYVRENVKQETDHQQHPTIGTNKYDRDLPLAITTYLRTESNISSDLQVPEISEPICPEQEQAKVYLQQGNHHYELKEYRKAIANYTEAIRLNPQDTKAYYKRGNSYRHLKEHQKAIADHTKAIRLNPQFATAYIKRGLSYQSLNHKNQAIKDFQQAANLYQQQGKTEDYQDVLDRIKQLQSKRRWWSLK